MFNSFQVSAMDNGLQAEFKCFLYRIITTTDSTNIRTYVATGWVLTSTNFDCKEKYTNTLTMAAIDSGT